MKAPRFWFRPPGLAAALLAPPAWIWRHGAQRRQQRGPGWSPGIPVICIGNLTVGGTGKTPTVIAAAQILGDGVHILSRGYGGKLAGPVQVDPVVHTADDVGDEPLLLAAFAPTWIARDRMAGAKAALRSGATTLLLDDGFQDPALKKDLSVVVVDAVTGFGNRRIIPAGPLREPVDVGLARAQAVLVIGKPADRTEFLSQNPDLHALVIEAELVPLSTGMDWPGARVFAFAGIGRPEKFFDTLAALGADVAGTEAFADHAPYADRILTRLQSRAKALGAQLVTTEKDAVRIPMSWRQHVLTLPVRLDTDETSLATLLKTTS